MTNGPNLRRVNFQSSREGAYRVKLVGEDPTSVSTALMMDRLAEPLQLQPGRYTAYIEDFASPGQTVQEIHVPAGVGEEPLVIALDEEEHPYGAASLWRPSRPSRNVPGDAFNPWEKTSIFKSEAEEGVRSRKFSVGLSCDRNPCGRGGWRAAELPFEQSIDPADSSLILTFSQPADWRKFPRWRLTVSVEDDVAWRVPLALFRGGLVIRLSPTATASGPDVAVRMMPKAPRTAALVGGLQKHFPDQPDALIEWSSGSPVESALSSLAEKMSDPWAAAAAALLLVRCGEVARVAQWVTNLNDRFPWLGDASVAAAWAGAATSPDARQVEARALELLIQGRRRGAPYFAASNVLALEMLGALATGSLESAVRARARRERAIWSRHGRRTMRTGVFLSWERSGAGLTTGDLPAANYEVVARGRLTPERISLQDR